jgi:hypothetical protein
MTGDPAAVALVALDGARDDAARAAHGLTGRARWSAWKDIASWPPWAGANAAVRAASSALGGLTDPDARIAALLACPNHRVRQAALLATGVTP